MLWQKNVFRSWKTNYVRETAAGCDDLGLGL